VDAIQREHALRLIAELKARIAAREIELERQRQEAKTAKITSWSIRADVVRRLDPGDLEPQAASPEQARESDQAPF